MQMKIGILYFTTCFYGFAILRHVDPFVRMLHNKICINKNTYTLSLLSVWVNVYEILDDIMLLFTYLVQSNILLQQILYKVFGI